MGKLHLSDLTTNGPFFCLTSHRLYNVLHQIPLIFIVPLIALFASDLRRYDLVGTLSSSGQSSLWGYSNSWTSDKSLPLDIVALVVLGHCVIWDFLWSTLLYRSERIPLTVFALVDFVLWAAVLGLGDTTLAMWCSTKTCVNYIGGCEPTSRGVMIAAGALMIVLSIVYHSRWIMVLHTAWSKRRQAEPSRKSDSDALHNTNAESTDGLVSPPV